MPEYTEGIMSDGAAILKAGVPMSVSEIVAALNRASALEERVKALEEAGFGVDRRIGSACIKALEAACQK